MTHPATNTPACLILADGKVFSGFMIGKLGTTIGEICFNTAMTGYQEILTDPSYAGQIITFTFPHIGNVGANEEDIESATPHAAGLILREDITEPSNFRHTAHLNGWLTDKGFTGICGIDTRALTRYIRKHGAQNVMIAPKAEFDKNKDALIAKLKSFPSMKGRELAEAVSTKKQYEWKETLWTLAPAKSKAPANAFHVVAVDYGVKHNILRNLADTGCRVTVVPAKTSAKDILALNPDGIFLSNGPGDPAATGHYSLPIIKDLIASGLPIFGICLGHQMLGLALGAKTEKMNQGHRGANHPVKELATGKVVITSQNHGFAVSDDALPADLEVTHRSLFDNTIQGLRHKKLPIFCLQGHPEASPGPHDTFDMFERFVEMMKKNKKRAA